MKVSVITATYNSASVVEDCLASVAEQIYENIEHVLIDGSSADSTLEVLQNHRPALAKIVSEPDDGIYDALNKGIKHATGEVIGFLHSDDVFSSNDVLKKVVSIFEAMFQSLPFTVI